MYRVDLSSQKLENVKKYAQHLASEIDELRGPWSMRFNLNNRPADFFESLVTGCLDTFPIQVERSKEASVQAEYCNGKYKRHIVKVQAICDHYGTIIWYNGTFRGAASDISMYEQFPPPLRRGELILADKAYCSESLASVLLAPIKKPIGKLLTAAANAYNTLHSR